MTLQLTPRYYKNLKWDLSPSNIIDTITGNVIANRVDEEFESVGNWTKNSGALKYYHTNINLPIALKTDGNVYTNYNTLIGWQRYNAANNKMLYGYGRREIVVLRGTFDFEVLGAIESVPSIDVSFTGNSREKTSGFSVGEFPSSYAPWNGGYEQLHSDYFSFNSWDKHMKNISGTTTTSLSTAVGRIGGTESSFSALVPTVAGNVIPSNFSYYGLIESKAMNANGIYVDTLNKQVSVLPLGSGQYRVTWEIPVRDLVMVNIRNNNTSTGVPGAINGAAIYLDTISSIVFNAKVKKYDTEKIQFEYSLDDDELTVIPSNQHPLKLHDCELITRDSILQSVPWKERISKLLLDKYIKGKYVITVDLDGPWALQNNITINTQITVVNIQGNAISRGVTPCLFEVKGIEKVFQQQTFIYRLILLEV